MSPGEGRPSPVHLLLLQLPLPLVVQLSEKRSQSRGAPVNPLNSVVSFEKQLKQEKTRVNIAGTESWAAHLHQAGVHLDYPGGEPGPAALGLDLLAGVELHHRSLGVSLQVGLDELLAPLVDIGPHHNFVNSTYFGTRPHRTTSVKIKMKYFCFVTLFF